MSKARSRLIVESLQEAFAPLMKADPRGFRGKFRTMASDPHAFYRGSACLFYADVTASEDPFATEDSGRIWIHGDLHVENFGTYLNAHGRLVFDVNDFDEAYLGRFTWDLQRFAASLALIGWQKALPEDVGAPAGGSLRAVLPQPGGRLPPHRRRRRRLRALPGEHRGADPRRARGRPAAAPRRPAGRADDRPEGRAGVRRRRHPAQAPGPGEEGRRGGLRGLPGDDPRRQALRPRPLLRAARRGRQVRASGSAAPACRRTTSSSRATARPWTTTWCCR